MFETATNSELYKLVLQDAPYVIWAYAILWIALCGYVTFILRRMLKIEKEIDVLSDTVGIVKEESN
ncbi:MAG: CcmD family protein [Coriobacteriia bacterium]|nr:CcmD family protein [Coriobacteriia bacterium]